MNIPELKRDLSGFTGTSTYHRIAPNALMTDGTKFLAEKVGAFWLFQDSAVYMRGYETQDDFAVLRLEPAKDGAFIVKCSDGNDHWWELFGASCTDFPTELMPFEFFASWAYEDEAWVFMLKSEY